MSPKIVKRKIRGFFKPEYLPIIRNAVKSVHNIITKASFLARQYYLFWYEKRLKNRKPLKKIDDEKDILEINSKIFNYACKIIKKR